MSNSALFLDRDGTLVKEKGYLSELSQLEILPGVAEGLKIAQDSGFKLVIISNQSGVARGYFSEQKVIDINQALEDNFKANGVQINKSYYCPHHPKAKVAAYRTACQCRKPNPGMLETAVAELSLDLSRSFLIGDKIADIETGKALGVKSIYLLTGIKSTYEQKPPVYFRPDFVARNFTSAIEWILHQNEKN